MIPRRILTVLLAVAAVVSATAARSAAPARPAGSDPEGQALAADLRGSRPAEGIEVEGLFKIRDGDGKRTQVPFRYRFVPGDTEWKNIYETRAGPGGPAEELVVIHAGDRPTRYVYWRSRPGASPDAKEREELTGDKAMVPLAGSDFWLADLGLEFLHWPEQRIVHEARIRMRKGRPCKVLESVNPAPGTSGYVRVRSWIDSETGQPILAEAYGRDNKLLKEFEIGSLTKVNGKWELKNLEMRNAVTDSRTVLEFRYEQK